MRTVDEDSYWENMRIHHEEDGLKRCPICEMCSDRITDLDRINYEGNYYHIDCWEDWQIDKIREESLKLQELNEPIYEIHE